MVKVPELFSSSEKWEHRDCLWGALWSPRYFLLLPRLLPARPLPCAQHCAPSRLTFPAHTCACYMFVEQTNVTVICIMIAKDTPPLVFLLPPRPFPVLHSN